MPDMTLSWKLQAWAEAVDSYNTALASEIARAAIPLLVAAKATDEEHAIREGNWAYWVHTIGGGQEIARVPVTE